MTDRFSQDHHRTFATRFPASDKSLYRQGDNSGRCPVDRPKIRPEQIILFGSHARGNAGSHSDIDLLVVPASLDDWPKRGNPIRRAIGEQFILPVDVLVTTHDRLAEQRNNPYSFVNTALESQEILYERAAF